MPPKERSRRIPAPGLVRYAGSGRKLTARYFRSKTANRYGYAHTPGKGSTVRARQQHDAFLMFQRAYAQNEGFRTPVTRPIFTPLADSGGSRSEVVRPKGFEPLTYGSGGRRSIQLSYGRVLTRLSS